MPEMPAQSPRQEDGFSSRSAPRVFAGVSLPQIVFSFAAMLGMGLVARVFYSLRSFRVDPDLWWHIRYGESILSTHHWPTVEQYSFTAAGQRWLSYEWLGDVLLAAAYRFGGLRGLGLLLILLGSAFALLLYHYSTVYCGNPKAGFLASAVLINLANSFNLRPQMFGYLFLLLTLILLQQFRRGQRRAVWLLPPLLLVWVNTHGSWIIGLGVVAVYLAGGLTTLRMGNAETQRWSASERRSLTLAFALAVAATLITPYGAGLAKFPFIVSSLPSGVANVQEWQPMAFQLPGDKLFLGLILGFFLLQLVARPKWRLEELALFLFGTVMACLHVRFLALFIAFLAPLLAMVLAEWLPRYDRTKEIYALNGAMMLAILAAMVWYFPSTREYTRIVAANFPVSAVEYLNTHPVPGPMYNSYEFGGYLLWSRPADKVFIDGRTEVYERAGAFQDQIALFDLKPGSLAVLDKYNIQSCLLLPDETLATVLAALPGWEKVYTDDRAVLFIRRRASDERLSSAALSGKRYPAGPS
jgi:hypothetical protein